MFYSAEGKYGISKGMFRGEKFTELYKIKMEPTVEPGVDQLGFGPVLQPVGSKNISLLLKKFTHFNFNTY